MTKARLRTFTEGAGVALVFLVVALVLGQDRFYRVDGHGIVQLLAAGEGTHPRHPLTIPIMRVFGVVLEPFGFDEFRIATISSACMTTLGIAFAHVGFNDVLGARGRALAATLLVGTCPAVLFFATVVEFHGVFFAFAGASFACAARVILTRSLVWSCVLGVCIALGAAAHGTGHVLSPILLSFLFFELRRRGASFFETVKPAAMTAVTHGALLTGSVLLASGATAGQQVGWWNEFLAKLPPISRLGLAFWMEWLRPYALISLLCFVAMWRRSRVAWTISLWLGIVVLVGTSYILIPRGDEHGAYLLPLALFASGLVAKELGLRSVFVVATLSLVLGVLEVRWHDTPSRARAWYESFERVDSMFEQRMLPLVGHIDEVDALVRYAPLRSSLLATHVLQALHAAPEGQVDATRGLTIRYLEIAIASGQVPLLTSGWRRALEETEQGRLLSREIERRWKLEPMQSSNGGFWRLVER